MKKVLFVAAIACLAMGCCKKAANNEGQEGACCAEKTECCQQAEATAEAAQDTIAVAEEDTTVEVVAEVAEEVTAE